MRINVYSQEIITLIGDEQMDGDNTHAIELVTKEADTGIAYHAVRQYLHSYGGLHDAVDDDDRSGITWWLPKSNKRREELAAQFEELAVLVRSAPRGTGLD